MIEYLVARTRRRNERLRSHTNQMHVCATTMFPISDNKLSLRQISDYWSREIQPPASADELLDLLEGAWWSGEIVGEASTSRLQLLTGMFKSAHPLGIVFLVKDQQDASEIKILPNGNVEVDIRPRVMVPSSDTKLWTDQTCVASFSALAKISSAKSYTALTPVLSAIVLSRDEFVAWLSIRQYNVPMFWSRVRMHQGDMHGSKKRAAYRTIRSLMQPPPHNGAFSFRRVNVALSQLS